MMLHEEKVGVISTAAFEASSALMIPIAPWSVCSVGACDASQPPHWSWSFRLWAVCATVTSVPPSIAVRLRRAASLDVWTTSPSNSNSAMVAATSER